MLCLQAYPNLKTIQAKQRREFREEIAEFLKKSAIQAMQLSGRTVREITQ